jgi:hypothetical protein
MAAPSQNPWQAAAEVTYDPRTSVWLGLTYDRGCFSLEAARDEATGRVSGGGRVALRVAADALKFRHMKDRPFVPEDVEVSLSADDCENLLLKFVHEGGDSYTYTFPDAKGELNADAEVTELGPFYAEGVTIACRGRDSLVCYAYSSAAP